MTRPSVAIVGTGFSGVEEVHSRLSKSVWAKGGCTSWYVNGKGRVTNNWPGLMSEYRRRTKRLEVDDYVFTNRKAEA